PAPDPGAGPWLSQLHEHDGPRRAGNTGGGGNRGGNAGDRRARTHPPRRRKEDGGGVAVRHGRQEDTMHRGRVKCCNATSAEKFPLPKKQLARMAGYGTSVGNACQTIHGCAFATGSSTTTSNVASGPSSSDASHHPRPLRPLACARPALISDRVPHPTKNSELACMHLPPCVCPCFRAHAARAARLARLRRQRPARDRYLRSSSYCSAPGTGASHGSRRLTHSS